MYGTGEGAIAEKFREVYMKIYNKNAVEDKVIKLTERIDKLINSNDAVLIKLINGEVVKQAVRFMKNNK